MITNTIKESFRGTTMITIAHRLRTSQSPLPVTPKSPAERHLAISSQTVIDYDRVLVLSAGRIVENGELECTLGYDLVLKKSFAVPDSPANLISQSDSEFRRLCMADGPTEYQYLLGKAGKGYSA